MLLKFTEKSEFIGRSKLWETRKYTVWQKFMRKPKSMEMRRYTIMQRSEIFSMCDDAQVYEDANVGNILNALVLYINEGGLKEALSEEYPDLAVESWREVIAPSITANLLNITIIHYDEWQ